MQLIALFVSVATWSATLRTTGRNSSVVDTRTVVGLRQVTEAVLSAAPTPPVATTMASPAATSTTGMAPATSLTLREPRRRRRAVRVESVGRREGAP